MPLNIRIDYGQLCNTRVLSIRNKGLLNLFWIFWSLSMFYNVRPVSVIVKQRLCHMTDWSLFYLETLMYDITEDSFSGHRYLIIIIIIYVISAAFYTQIYIYHVYVCISFKWSDMYQLGTEQNTMVVDALEVYLILHYICLHEKLMIWFIWIHLIFCKRCNT